jgi:hypothetical protein
MPRVSTGDRVRVHVDGDRRPPLVGVVIHVRSCESVSSSCILAVESDDDRHVTYVPSCADVELLEPLLGLMSDGWMRADGVANPEVWAGNTPK